MVMVSVGVMFMMNGIVRFIIGPNDQRFSDGQRFIIKAREFKEMTGLDEGLAIRTTQALTVVIAIVLVAALFWFLQKTKTGKAMRAFSDNEDLALLSGIDPDKIVRVHLDIGGCIGDDCWCALWPRQKLQTVHIFSVAVANFLGGNCRRNWAHRLARLLAGLSWRFPK